MSKGSKGLPPGWKSIVKIRKQGKSAGRKDFYLFSPDNVKIRSKVQLQCYLKDTKSKYTVDDFDIPSSAPTKAKQPTVIKKNKASNKIVQARIAKKSLNSKSKDDKKILPKSVGKGAKATTSSSSRSNSIAKSASSSKSKIPPKKRGKPTLTKRKPALANDDDDNDDESPVEDESPATGNRKSSVKKDVKPSNIKGKKSPAKAKDSAVKSNSESDEDKPTVKGKDGNPSKIVLKVFSPAKTAKKISKQALKSAQKSVSKSPKKASGNDIDSAPGTTLVNSKSPLRASMVKTRSERKNSSPIPDLSPDVKSTKGRSNLMAKPSGSSAKLASKVNDGASAPNKKQPVAVSKKPASNASKKSNVNKK